MGLPSLPAIAAEPAFGFRGGQLGVSPASLKSAIAGKFPRQEEVKTPIALFIHGTDKEGSLRTRCPMAAPLTKKMVNCLRATYIHWPRKGNLILTVIKVEQSFSTAIPTSEVLKKLKSAYGTPRLRFENNEIAPGHWPDSMVSDKDDIAFVWGGNLVPAPPYRPGVVIGDDYNIIRGKYITGILYRKGDLVSGIELVIADSDSALLFVKEVQDMKDHETSGQQRKNIESLKY